MSYPTAGPPYPPAPGAPPPYPYAQPLPLRAPRKAGVWQAIAASAAVVLVVIAHFFEIAKVSSQAALLDDLESGQHVTLAQARASDHALSRSVILFLGMSFIAVIFVMIWAYYARTNAESYTQSEFRRSRGWAIGGWICPVVNLWFPFQVVKDVWAASDTERPADQPIKTWATSAILPLWWTALIASRVVERISASVYNSSDTASGVHTSLVLDFASAACDIAAAITFILLVAAITRFQGQRYDAAIAQQQPVPAA